MRHALHDATFIIPVRIESSDRMRNVIASLTFLLENFDTNIILKEVDKESVYKRNVLPILRDIIDLDINVRHIFVEDYDDLFHRQKILNEMIFEADTKIVVNYDCDVILPVDSYILAYDLINTSQCDIVYPYGQGLWQKQVFATDDIISLFFENYDYSILDNYSKIHTSDFGWVQFFNRQVYIDGGMENENFKSYSPEDKERFYRFEKMGYNIRRIENYVYHLEHFRGDNSWFTNPFMSSNFLEWEKIQKMDKNELIQYYQNQEYLKRYIK